MPHRTLSLLACGLLLLVVTSCRSDDEGGGSEASTTTARPKAETTTTVSRSGSTTSEATEPTERTGPTEAVPGCPTAAALPLEAPVEEECLPGLLRWAAEANGVELTPAAEAEAIALCQELDRVGFPGAMVSTFRAWEEGTRPSPSPDQLGFSGMAVGLYCPEYAGVLSGGYG